MQDPNTQRLKDALNKIRADFPTATQDTIDCLLVNQLRHQDKEYKKNMKKKGMEPEVYKRYYKEAMDRIKKAYPNLTQEVNRQWDNKRKYH